MIFFNEMNRWSYYKFTDFISQQIIIMKRNIITGLLQPKDVNSALAAVGYRIEEAGRESGKTPSEWLSSMGIILPADIIDSWDYVQLGRFAEIKPSVTIVDSPDFPLSEINEIGEDDE